MRSKTIIVVKLGREFHGYSILVCDDGKVFGFGDNNKGAIGIEEKYSLIPKEIPIPNQSKISSVSCGTNHTLFLSGKQKYI